MVASSTCMLNSVWQNSIFSPLLVILYSIFRPCEPNILLLAPDHHHHHHHHHHSTFIIYHWDLIQIYIYMYSKINIFASLVILFWYLFEFMNIWCSWCLQMLQIIWKSHATNSSKQISLHSLHQTVIIIIIILSSLYQVCSQACPSFFLSRWPVATYCHWQKIGLTAWWLGCLWSFLFIFVNKVASKQKTKQKWLIHKCIHNIILHEYIVWI